MLIEKRFPCPVKDSDTAGVNFKIGRKEKPLRVRLLYHILLKQIIKIQSLALNNQINILQLRKSMLRIEMNQNKLPKIIGNVRKARKGLF